MTYVFGSWFDPVTKAHEAILKKLQKDVMQEDDKLIVSVVQNDEKRDHAPVETRYAMVNDVLTAKNITATLVIQNQRMWDFLHQDFFDGIKPNDITIVIGQDEFDALLAGKWKHSEKLMKNYHFIVFRREKVGITHYSLKYDDNFKFMYIDDEFVDVSSTAVREIFRRNPECHYKDVQEHISRPVFKFIKDNTMYNQNPRNYAEIEKQFIDDYKKRGWGKFANTVDILAVSGDEVLLIRRKKPPYQGYFALPGGFFDPVDMIDKETGETIKADEDLEHAAARELREETSLDIPAEKFEQIKTYSHIFDPRLRIVDTAFAVHVHHKDKKKAVAGDDAADAAWFNIHDLPKMAFHHEQIITDWLTELQ